MKAIIEDEMADDGVKLRVSKHNANLMKLLFCRDVINNNSMYSRIVKSTVEQIQKTKLALVAAEELVVEKVDQIRKMVNLDDVNGKI